MRRLRQRVRTALVYAIGLVWMDFFGIEFLDRLFFGTGPLRFVQQWVGLGHPTPFEWMSLLGDTWGIIAAIGVAMWLRGPKTVYALLAAIALASVTKELMSMAFSVPRPQGDGIVVYEHLEVASFPSGHVFQILIAWGVLYVRRVVPLAVPVVVVLAVGFSRLYLGTHFLGDVVFAVLFGILFIWIFERIWPPLWAWLSERSLKFYLFLSAAAVVGVVVSLIVRLNNPRRWEILGMVIGISISLFIEHRYLRYAHKAAEGVSALLRVGVGVAGILLLLFIDRNVDQNLLVVQLLLAALAVGWALLGAPALFQAFGRRKETVGGERS